MTQIINFIKTNPFFHSIRFRLVLWFSSILIVVLILFSTFIYYIQARDLRRDSLEQLDGRMVGLQQSLVQLMSGSSGTLAFPTEYIREQDIFISRFMGRHLQSLSLGQVQVVLNIKITIS